MNKQQQCGHRNTRGNPLKVFLTAGVLTLGIIIYGSGVQPANAGSDQQVNPKVVFQGDEVQNTQFNQQGQVIVVDDLIAKNGNSNILQQRDKLDHGSDITGAGTINEDTMASRRHDDPIPDQVAHKQGLQTAPNKGQIETNTGAAKATYNENAAHTGTDFAIAATTGGYLDDADHPSIATVGGNQPSERTLALNGSNTYAQRGHPDIGVASNQAQHSLN